MFEYLRKRPMIIAAAGCIVSAVCGFYFKSGVVICLILSILVLLFGIFKKKATLIIIVAIILIVTFSCLNTIKEIDILSAYEDKVISAEICALSTTYKSDMYYRSEVEILNSKRLPKGTKLSLWHSPASFRCGEILRAQIKIEKIDEDYKATNYSNGIYLSGNILDFQRTSKTDTVLTATAKLRDYIKDTFFENMSYQSAGTMCALVFGDRSYFTDEFYANVKASGVAHAMVVSGMHLSVLVTLVLKIIERLFYNPYLKALIMFLTVIAVCGVCGFTMSILRAGVTYIVMAVGLLFERPYSGENALSAAVCFILISSPFSILNVGFQLSILSTFGIVSVALPVCDFLKNKYDSKLLLGICDSTILSISATVLTLPIIIYIFGSISVVSVITNLLVDMPLNYCLSLSVMALILNNIIPFVSSLALKVIDYIIRYVNASISYWGSRSYSTIKTPKWAVLLSVLVILIIFEAMLTCKKRQNMLKLKAMNEKILAEGRSGTKWQSFLRKH